MFIVMIVVSKVVRVGEGKGGGSGVGGASMLLSMNMCMITKIYFHTEVEHVSNSVNGVIVIAHDSVFSTNTKYLSP